MADNGSWHSLLVLTQQARDIPDLTPVACPNDGEPLTTGPDGQLFCTYDGFRPNGLSTRPPEPLALPSIEPDGPQLAELQLAGRWGPGWQ